MDLHVNKLLILNLCFKSVDDGPLNLYRKRFCCNDIRGVNDKTICVYHCNLLNF